MIPAIFPKKQKIIRPAKKSPCISVIMPFEPKMCAKSKLAGDLNNAVRVVQSELENEYPAFTTDLLIKRLKALIASIDYATHKKGIAIFVCSGFEKIYYLDIEVKEKIIVNHSFGIKDIILNKQASPAYLLLILSNKKAKIFIGKGRYLTPLINNSCRHIEAVKNDIAEKVSNFSDPKHRKEVLIKKFLRRVDDGLHLLLNAYPLPLFIACTTKTLGYFKQLSKNAGHIVEYIHGNYEDSSVSELENILQPYLEDWDTLKEKHLLLKIGEARNKNNCITGIKNVYKSAGKRGKLLIMEKNYSYPAFKGDDNELNSDESTLTDSFYIKDAVDDIIEQVLLDGGDVEFVNDGVLKSCDRIALI